MKKFLAAGLGMLALAAMQPANAADMPVKAVYKAPPVEVWSWTGFYIGLNGGYSWGRSRTHVDYFNTVTGLPIVPPAGSITDVSFNMNGGVFGGQAGMNWQIDRSWVFGIEADAQWTGQRGTGNFLCATVAGGGIPGACLPGLTFTPAGVVGSALTLEEKLKWFGTLRGRLGLLASPSVLLYATGGLAVGGIDVNGALTGFGGNGLAVTTALSTTTTKAGWTVGGGIEGRLGGNWTGKLEYLYLDFGTISGTIVNPAGFIGANYRSRITDNVFRAGINYKFGSAVVAAY